LTEPELLADSRHGQYMMQLCIENLSPFYKKQFEEQAPEWVQKAIKSVEHPDHIEAVMYITDYLDFQTEDGVDFRTDFAERGLYAIPVSFYESEEAEEFFGI
jgi:hypothetical protein